MIIVPLQLRPEFLVKILETGKPRRSVTQRLHHKILS
jgi:hypothetical protein